MGKHYVKLAFLLLGLQVVNTQAKNIPGVTDRDNYQSESALDENLLRKKVAEEQSHTSRCKAWAVVPLFFCNN